jgi:molybdopterin synthase sulfur carrier subunit
MPPVSKKTSISIKIKFFTTLREIVGKKDEQIQLSESTTLEVLLKQLSKKYGEDFEDYVYDELGKVRGHLQFLINGKSASTAQGLKTKLREDDEIAILPPVGGG